MNPASRLTAIFLFLLVALSVLPAPADLVLHWKFNEGTGTTANDSTGNGHDGTLTNMDAADWVNTGLPSVPSGSSYALDFDGGNDFVLASDDAFKGVTGTLARTIAAWVKTAKGDAAIANWGANAVGQKWTFRKESSRHSIRVEINGAGIVGDTAINDGDWHHVAAVVPSHATPTVSHIRLYIDGELQGISTHGTTAINTAASQNFRIGRDFNGGRYMLGGIDEVRLYDHRLTSAEIRALAGTVDNYADTVLADNPIAYWRMNGDEKVGNRCYNEGSLGAGADATYSSVEAGDVGKPGLIADNDNQCVYFGDDSDQVNIPDHAAINTSGPYTNKTVETWFKVDPAAAGRDVIYEQGGTGNGINQFVRLDTSYYLYTRAWAATAHGLTRIPINANEVYHAVSVFKSDTNPGTFILYLNGVPICGKVNDNVDPIASATGDCAIGAKRDATVFDNGNSTGNGNRFRGHIDEVALYNDVLTLEQIQTHYAIGSGDRLGIMEYAVLGAMLNYDAANDDDGNTVFEDSIGSRQNNATANSFDWNLAGVTDSSRKSVNGGVLSKIQYAYRFDGSDTAWCLDFDSLAGNPTFFSASMEIVFKPTDFAGQEALLETGGNGTGTAIWLDGSTLRFDVKQGTVNARAAYDLAGLPAAQQASFIHVVGVADLDGDQALLYVNGVLRNAPFASGNLTDWGGTDDSGLGSVRGTQAFGTPGGLSGDIALLRFYPHILEDGKVSQNYEALLSRGAIFAVR